MCSATSCFERAKQSPHRACPVKLSIILSPVVSTKHYVFRSHINFTRSRFDVVPHFFIVWTGVTSMLNATSPYVILYSNREVEDEGNRVNSRAPMEKVSKVPPL